MKRESDKEVLIEELAKNNRNFEQRSEFSQKKYLDKKRSKYRIIVFIEKVTFDSINKFNMKLEKNYFLREDLLWSFLNQIQLRQNKNYFVSEKVNGLVLSYLAQGLDSSSKVYIFDPLHRTDSHLNLKKYESVKWLGQQEKVFGYLPLNKETLPQTDSIDYLIICSNISIEEILS